MNKMKDKRLQIRVTEEEMAGISRRARAAGMTVADYGRKRLLFDVTPVAEESVAMELELETNNQVECYVEDMPPGVVCIECGRVHGP